MIGDDGVQKLYDSLLSRRGGIEFATHLDEALIDMLAEAGEVLTEIDEVLAEVDKVLSHGVETCRRGLAELTKVTAELAELAAELTDVAVGGSGQYPGGGGVLFARLHSCPQVANLVFQRGDA
ncbi:hypothetical protein A9W99_17525 [Mycobacterium sp. 1164966.3]|nr:hypothetical protein A9W99_17525 [Mycobacterium sp. 1164966.3]